MLRNVCLALVLCVTASLPAGRCVAQDYWYDPTPAFSVPGRLLEVNLGNCGPHITPYSSERFCDDWVRVQYYDPDGRLRDNWFAAPNSGYARPCVGDLVTCDIRTDNYGLLRVRDWYRARDRIMFRYAPPYPRHYIRVPRYHRPPGSYFYPHYYDPQPYHGPTIRYKPPQRHPPAGGPDERPRHRPGERRR